MTIQTTISQDGQRPVTITEADYQDLVDARDVKAALRAVAAGTLQTLSGDGQAWPDCDLMASACRSAVLKRGGAGRAATPVVAIISNVNGYFS